MDQATAAQLAALETQEQAAKADLVKLEIGDVLAGVVSRTHDFDRGDGTPPIPVITLERTDGTFAAIMAGTTDLRQKLMGGKVRHGLDACRPARGLNGPRPGTGR